MKKRVLLYADDKNNLVAIFLGNSSHKFEQAILIVSCFALFSQVSLAQLGYDELQRVCDSCAPVCDLISKARSPQFVSRPIDY